MTKHLNICTLRKLLFVLLYIMGYGNLNSQVVKDYYKYINQAEIAFYDGDAIAAQKSYEQAFSLKDAPQFACDLYNYGYVCILLKDYQKSYVSFKRIITLGLSTNHFKISKDSLINEFLGTKFGEDFKRDWDKFTLDSGINKDLRNRLYNLKVIDQKFRRMENGYTVYKDSIIKYDHAVVDSIRQIFREYNGIPDERTIGIDTFSVNSPIYYIMLLHQSEGVYSRKYDYSNDIMKAVEHGKMNNKIAADLLQRANWKFTLGEQNFRVLEFDTSGLSQMNNDGKYMHLPEEKFCIGYIPLSDSSINEINSRRLLLHLPSLDQGAKIYAAKILNNKPTLPESFFMVNHFVLQKKEDFDDWCKKLKKL